MDFLYTPKIQTYMRQKNKHNIIIEVISSSSSDFEVTELHVHFISEKQAAFFLESKHFRSMQTKMGLVLLPPYRLEYADTITFDLKSFLGIKYITQEGITL